MRTTLTLEPDVARLLEEATHHARKSFKQVVNEALRRGLSSDADARRPFAFVVAPHQTSLRPGHDPARLNQLADEIEVEEFLMCADPGGL